MYGRYDRKPAKCSLRGKAQERLFGALETAAEEDCVGRSAVSRELGDVVLQLVQGGNELSVGAVIRRPWDVLEVIRCALELAERPDGAAGQAAAAAIDESLARR
jgi:hypothetical protein